MNLKKIKKHLTLLDLEKQNKVGGIPIVWKNNKTVYVTNRDNHTLLIGGTGSGKTQSIILPTINVTATTDESLIIYDSNGEIYQRTANLLRDKGYEVLILNYTNPNTSVCYNPLMLAYQFYQEEKIDESIKLIEDIGYYLLKENDSRSDPFWENMAVDLFTGISFYLFENAKENEINLSSIYNIIEKLNNDEDYENFIKKIDKEKLYGKYLNEVLSNPFDTTKSIISVAKFLLKPFVFKDKLSKMMSISEFNFKDLLNKKIAVYLIGNNLISRKCIPLFIDQIYSSMELYSIKKEINIILDEFDILNPISDFSIKINNSRYLGISYILVSQSLEHLISKYGKEEFSKIRISIGNLIYLTTNDLDTTEEFVKICNTLTDNKSLVGVKDFRTLNSFEAVILLPRLLPYKIQLLPSYKINWSHEMIEANLEERKLPPNVKVYKEKE